MKSATIILLTLFLAVACRTEKDWHTSSAFTLEKATLQRWTGGAAGSGKGIRYFIRLRYKDRETLQIKGVWVDGRYFKPEIKEFGREGILEGADLLFEYHEGNNPSTGEHFENPPQADKAPEFDGAALIEYTYKGKDYRFLVDRFTEAEPVIYP